jgi:hypothetical protein
VFGHQFCPEGAVGYLTLLPALYGHQTARQASSICLTLHQVIMHFKNLV